MFFIFALFASLGLAQTEIQSIAPHLIKIPVFNNSSLHEIQGDGILYPIMCKTGGFLCLGFLGLGNVNSTIIHKMRRKIEGLIPEPLQVKGLDHIYLKWYPQIFIEEENSPISGNAWLYFVSLSALAAALGCPMALMAFCPVKLVLASGGGLSFITSRLPKSTKLKKMLEIGKNFHEWKKEYPTDLIDRLAFFKIDGDAVTLNTDFFNVSLEEYDFIIRVIKEFNK